ncbi:hypothetical protein [Psychrobacillus soli]|uniref:Uncharacterized protein n=1 Tax=Psychrobacillus soli TaxID=1543965 RepID=A0A544T5H2_9BACI|nr:hypothetical protein [Psychrobacillus soli]TQR12702.1 hypothetical protein FG383_13220 [Psychrobacillus soli]
MFTKISKISLPILITLGLLITIPINTAAATKVMWGKTELKIGQIGKVTILQDTPLVKIESNGSLTIVRMLKKDEEFRVYSYKGQNSGLYGVGGGSFIQKNTAKVKYETPSKAKLALVSGIKDNTALEVVDIQ